MDYKEDLPAFEKEIIRLHSFSFMKEMAVHRFVLPDGTKRRWESVFYSGVSNVLIAGITPQKKMLIVKRFRLPVENWTLELPGGDAEADEDLVLAAKREFQEETGYGTKEPFEQLTRGWTCASGTNVPFIIFFALNCEKVCSPRLDPVEKSMGLRTLEKEPKAIMEEIAQGYPLYDQLISHSLIALLARGIIKL